VRVLSLLLLGILWLGLGRSDALLHDWRNWRCGGRFPGVLDAVLEAFEAFTKAFSQFREALCAEENEND
jgi:hypothetical protein